MESPIADWNCPRKTLADSLLPTLVLECQRNSANNPAVYFRGNSRTSENLTKWKSVKTGVSLIMEVISYSANVCESLRQDYSWTLEDIRGLTRTAKSPRECRVLSRTFEDSFSWRMSAKGLSRKRISVIVEFQQKWQIPNRKEFLSFKREM